jgi:serine phosphatase RsbU (regulator of sigma subunit)/FixJ family two-component response regulator
MSNLSQARVLVVDDEADIAQLISLMIRQSNIEINIATNGREGITMAEDLHPDVIITDLMMPEVDGFSLMKKVQQQNIPVPVIMVTAFGSVQTAIQALRLGAFDFLIKPFERHTVRDILTRAIDERIQHKCEAWLQTLITSLGPLRNTQQIAQTVLELITNRLGAKYGVIGWVDNSLPPVEYGFPPNDALTTLSLHWAKENLSSSPSNNLETHLGHIQSPVTFPNDEAAPPLEGSIIGVPLITQRTLLGYLLLLHPETDFFSQIDSDFLQTLIPYVTLSLNNAKTYNNLKATNQRLSTIQSINALAYNARIPMNRTLRLAVEGIRQNLGYNDVLICLPDPDSEYLTVRAAAGHLDRQLMRKGDDPSRRIAFSLSQADVPFVKAFTSRQVQHDGIDSWLEMFRAAQAPDFAQILKRHDSQQGISLPLWQGEEVIGVLGLAHDQPSLSAETHTTLTTVTNQVALVVKSAMLYQTEQQRRREMEALYHAGLAITSTLSHAAVLKQIGQHIIGLTNANNCLITRWDYTHDIGIIEIHLQKTPHGLEEIHHKQENYPLRTHPMVKTVVDSAEMRLVYSTDDHLSPLEQAWMADHHASVNLILPLTIRGKSIGVLELISTAPEAHYSQQTIRIAQGLAAQAAIALENARLHEAETKRVEKEMELAQRIQVSLLPHETPEVPGLDIAARSASARVVGGDFYRYLTLPDDKFGVVIGDISGKGVPGAIFMAIVTTAMDTQVRQEKLPGDMLQRLNTSLLPRMQANKMNAALMIVIFDPQKGQVQVANAGMIAPLVGQNQQYRWLDVHGLPLGITEDALYNTQTLSLEPDLNFILLSDGLLEAQTPTGELYGFERLMETAKNLPAHNTSHTILDTIWNSVETYIPPAQAHDDMTLVIIKT